MTDAPIIETQGLVKRFGGVEVLRGIDFSVRRGELRCLIGPNGAGKSTFFKCLSGQLRPCEGVVKFRGDSIQGGNSAAVARRGIGIKTQVPNLFDSLSAYEHVWLAARRKKHGASLVETVQRIVATFRLEHLGSRSVGQLAHGQRQLVEIAMVVASEPDIILLDEPAAGMTHHDIERLAELVSALKENHSLVIVEHDMNFVRMIANRVTVLHQGKVLVEDDVEAVMRDASVRDVYLGRGRMAA